MQKATGRYLAFLDSDDLWNPKKLSIQISFMEQKDAHFCCTGCCVIDENGKLIPENTAILNGRYIAPDRGWVFRKGESILSAEYEIVEVCAHSTEMTSNSPVYYSEEGTLIDNAVTVWTEKDGTIHVHNSSAETLSELTILVLYLDKNGYICGKRDIVTGREQVQSINDMNSDFVSSVIDLPESVDYSKTIVYLSGGYVK